MGRLGSHQERPCREKKRGMDFEEGFLYREIICGIICKNVSGKKMRNAPYIYIYIY